MITPQLLEYLKTQLALGINRETITSTLVAQGWAAADVNEGFTTLSGAPTPPSNISAVQIHQKNHIPLVMAVIVIILLVVGAGVYGYLKINSQNGSQSVSNYQNSPANLASTTGVSSIQPIGSPSQTTSPTVAAAINEATDSKNEEIILVARNDAMTYYNNSNSYTGFCENTSDQTLNKIKTALAGSNFQCKDNQTSFAISISLVEGSSWCTDSSGFTGNGIVGSNSTTFRCN